MAERYKEFPPGWGHVKLPTSSREAALAGLALYTPCKPLGAWAHRVAWATTALFGPSFLPGIAASWTPPMAADIWKGLIQQWRARLGSFDAMAVYQRLQAERAGLSVLLIDGRRPRAFVKVGTGARAAFDTEREVLERVSRHRLASFSAPDPLLSGEHADWHYLAVSPLPVRPHRAPSRPPLERIVAEIESALAELPRPPDTPEHWKPMHGDFTPWNLRQLGRGELVLLDWEDAGFGPAGADEVLYRATASALRRAPAPPSPHGEAIAFWEERVRLRVASSRRDGRLAQSVLETLEGMRAGASDE